MRSLIKGDQKVFVYHQNMNGCPVTSGDTFTNDRVNSQVLFAAISGDGFPISAASFRSRPTGRPGNRGEGTAQCAQFALLVIEFRRPYRSAVVDSGRGCGQRCRSSAGT
jgi:hypothetical protein